MWTNSCVSPGLKPRGVQHRDFFKLDSFRNRTKQKEQSVRGDEREIKKRRKISEKEERNEGRKEKE